MRIKFLLTAILCSVVGFAQSVNDYKAVIIPLKYDFMKTDNPGASIKEFVTQI